jgi:aromatic ring-cleaving dioxygenase
MNARTRKKLDKAIHELTDNPDLLDDDTNLWLIETLARVRDILKDAYEKGKYDWTREW